MRVGAGRTLGIVALLALGAPTAAAASPGLSASVRAVHGHGATAAAPVNVLTLGDQRGIDNRVNVFADQAGRLTLTAPEGLGDPDGSGASCSLDNAKADEASATQVSCAPGYIGAIVGDLGGGNDSFDADPALGVLIGTVIDGVSRPLSGGPGRDRLVGGALADLLGGAGGGDALIGSSGEDLLIGGAGPDNLAGGAANDVLLGGGGQDKLNGGGGRDLCRGAGGFDSGRGCELARSIP